MITDMKKAVRSFRKKYKYYGGGASRLEEVLDMMGYTLVYFNSVCNDADVAEVIKKS